MSAKSYSYLSLIYSHLMRFINYKDWAKYLAAISKEIPKEKIAVLEIACGNGALSKNLRSKFKNYLVSDLSFDMLQSFKHKFSKKIVCDMTALPFKNKYDFIFSAFDSINYLLKPERFIKMLQEVSCVISADGIFTFDVSLEKNSLKYQRYLNRAGKVDGLKYRQRSYFNQKSRIHYNHFEITLANGEKVEEIHKQKIYRFEDYFTMIESSDWYVYQCLNAFTFDNANSETERAQFVLKKRNKNANI